MALELPNGFVDLYTASVRIGAELNLIGVVSDFLAPSKSRGTDWTCTFCLADQFHGRLGESGHEGLKVRFFKKKEDLPAITQLGDVVILRNVRVKQWAGITMAMSSFGSTWNVFPALSIPKALAPSFSQIPFKRASQAQQPTTDEMKYAAELFNALNEHYPLRERLRSDDTSAQNNSEVNIAIADKRQKFALVEKLRVDSFHDIVAQVIKIHPCDSRVDLYVSDYTANMLLYSYEWDKTPENEKLEGSARDGDEYSYISRTTAISKKWPGPYGKLTLPVTLWPPHADFAMHSLKEGNFVLLQNVHIRHDKEYKMVGSLHTDRRFHDKICIHRIEDLEQDDRVKDIVRRKRTYQQKFNVQSAQFTKAAQRSNVASGEKPLSKTKLRKRKRDERIRQEKEEAKRQRNALDETGSLEQIKVDAIPNIPPSKPSIIRSASSISDKNLNPNVRCSNHLRPTLPLSEITSTKHLSHTTPEGNTYILPFQNVNTRSTVHVVDFFPHDLADFSVHKPRNRKQRSEFAILSDYSGSEGDDDNDCSSNNDDHNDDAEPQVSHETDARQAPAGSSSTPTTRDSQDDSQLRRAKSQDWEWRFCLLLSDAHLPNSDTLSAPPEPSQDPPPTKTEPDLKRPSATFIKAYVSGPDAECLLKLDAVDLRASPRALSELREKLFLLWGDLEERKTAAREQRQQRRQTQKGREVLGTIDGNSRDKNEVGGKGEEEDEADEENDSFLSQRESVMTLGLGAKDIGASLLEMKSPPFECCLKEYGVKVRDEVANDDGRRRIRDRRGAYSWERRWRMHGCTIV